jgi:hypothetical protein
MYRFRDSAISPTRKAAVFIQLATDATTNSIETLRLRALRAKVGKSASRDCLHASRPTS